MPGGAPGFFCHAIIMSGVPCAVYTILAIPLKGSPGPGTLLEEVCEAAGRSRSAATACTLQAFPRLRLHRAVAALHGSPVKAGMFVCSVFRHTIVF